MLKNLTEAALLRWVNGCMNDELDILFEVAEHLAAAGATRLGVAELLKKAMQDA